MIQSSYNKIKIPIERKKKNKDKINHVVQLDSMNNYKLNNYRFSNNNQSTVISHHANITV